VALGSRHPVPWSGPALEVVLYLLFAILGAYLAYLVMAQLPRTLHPTGTR
jgi:protein-S-isoprenylcysteine O-methyltransferase Ste14